MGLLSALDRLAERYDNWYQRAVVPTRPKSHFPKCMFCHASDRAYNIGPSTLMNHRYLPPMVRCTVQCRHCGMRYQASRYPESKRWTFDAPR